MDERSIFEQALDLTDPSRRSAFLEETCGQDRPLRERIEALLHSHEEAGSFLQEAAVQATATYVPSVTEKPGSTIGPYKLLQQIGEGGMGVVFMAEQTDPVERRVALKIIKPGMDTQEVIARFEAERQALAMMDHPNIAKVLDAGTTDSGRPYFVMELVKGMPVTKFCDEQHLSPRERLELFVPICQAVQHAHQKGIIHRDLKPSNILVAQYDNKPVPKIIDFGVAKAVSHRLTEKTMFTRYGQIVGTIEYMSPEQARFNQLDVDTRSDVYSLGVLLYELLTGETPFDSKRLRAAAFDELLRIIREEEPPKPSTKLSSSASRANTAVNRKTEPRKLSLLIRGDLDWIVMKALEKDRNRRYETATSFAADIQHYLNDEPVTACPPSAAYKFRKFARRHRTPMAITAAALLVLLAVAIGSTIAAGQFRQLASEKQRALDKATTAEAIAKAVNDFMTYDVFGLADATNRSSASLPPDPDVKLRTLLDRSKEQIDVRFKDTPLVRAEVQSTVGLAFHAIGRYPEAVDLLTGASEFFRDTLGAEHERTLKALTDLGEALRLNGQYQDAVRVQDEVLESRRKTLGQEDPDHPDLLLAMYNVAVACAQSGPYDRSVALHKKTLEKRRKRLGPEHIDTLRSMMRLGEAYHMNGQFEDALEMGSQALEGFRKILPPDHPLLLDATNLLGIAYLDAGRYSEARPLLEQNLAAYQRVLGDDHPTTVTAMGNLALGFYDLQDYEKALPLTEKVRDLRIRKHGEKHPDSILAMFNLAALYVQLNRNDEAIDIIERCLELYSKTLGADHFHTRMTKIELATVYMFANRIDDAIPLLEDAYDASEQNPTLRLVVISLAEAYWRAMRRDDFFALLEKEPSDPNLQRFRAIVLLSDGKVDEYRQVVEQLRGSCAASDLHRQRADFASVAALQPIPDQKRAAALATIAPLDFPGAPRGYRHAVAVTQLRCGEFSKAIQGLQEINQEWVDSGESLPRYSPAITWYWLAIASHHQGDLQKAGQWLERANQWTAKGPRETDPSYTWLQPMIHKILRDEAEQLISTADSPQPQERSSP